MGRAEGSLVGDAPDKGRQAVCAFANDLPGHRQPGVLFVGARDDGSPSGLPVTDEMLRTLADMKTDGQIVPPPTLLVERRILRGAAMAVVTVQPADAPPVRYRGRIWIRVGPRRAIATAQDERLLNERRRHRDLPFDLQPVFSASLSDLNRRSFEEDYLHAAFAPDVLAANDRSYPERLAACRMITGVNEPLPTVMGILTLGTRPEDYIAGAFVQFLRLDGPRLSDPVRDSRRISGPLPSMLRELDLVLAAQTRTRVDITSAPTERRSSDYPLPALRQLTRNAVMHRTYEATHAPIRILWFTDRLEILSPGGPFGLVTVENFGRPGLVDYRNPGVAEAMRVLGFVQRFGVGLAIARQELSDNGNPPMEIEATAHHVLICLRPAP